MECHETEPVSAAERYSVQAGGKIWLLYQKYAEKGYTSTKPHSYSGSDGSTHTKVHTYWTQRGRLFIYDLLKADGILPLVELEV